MKRLHWGYWLALGLLTALFLLVRLPAGIVGALVSSQSGGKLTFAAAEGTLWNGSAQPVLDGAALAERLSWSWQPKALLKGQLGYALTLDDGRALLGLGIGGIRLTEADLGLAATPLFLLDERTRNYGLSGQLRLSTAEFRWQGGKGEGQLNLDWRGAASSLAPSISPLGDYRLTLAPAGEAWHVQLATLGGQLQLNGGGELRAGQGLSMEVGLRAAAGAEAALAPFLNQVGPGDPAAERRLRFSL